MTPGELALAEAARLETARVYGRTCPERRPAERAAESQLFARPDDSYYGPAPAEVIDDLVDALDADAPRERLTAAGRRSVEQAIARGLDDQAAAADTGTRPAAVARVRAAMDRLSA